MPNILICDDEKDIVNALKIYLSDPDYQIFEAYNGREAVELLDRQEIHLILMDIMMPQMDGITAMTKIREKSNIPIILLTAKSEDADKILGLNVGADDYITKPFSLAILRARVAAVLRDREAANHSGDTSLRVQISGEENAGQECSIGNGSTKKNNAWQYSDSVFDFDFEAMCFTAAGDRVELSKTEQRLLRILVTNRGQTLRREYLLARIWPDGTEYVDANALSVTMRRLREKLPGIPVRTVYGIGYVWEERTQEP